MRILRPGWTLLNQQWQPEASRWDSLTWPELSEHLTRVFKSRGVKSVTTNHSTRPEDRTAPEMESGGVYDSTCDSCEEHYTEPKGEDDKRLNEHRRQTSAARERHTQTGHSVDWKEVKDHGPGAGEQTGKDIHLMPESLFNQRQRLQSSQCVTSCEHRSTVRSRHDNWAIQRAPSTTEEGEMRLKAQKQGRGAWLIPHFWEKMLVRFLAESEMGGSILLIFVYKNEDRTWRQLA